MRTTILLLIAACLTGCATHKSSAPPPPAVATASAPMNAVESADGLPDPNSQLSPQQIAQLKGRLGLLRVGMSRDKVMEILNISSFNVQYYANANSTGITYRFNHNHVLTAAFATGDYEVTLRWARFDTELWPKNSAGIKDNKATSPKAQ